MARFLVSCAPLLLLNCWRQINIHVKSKVNWKRNEEKKQKSNSTENHWNSIEFEFWILFCLFFWWCWYDVSMVFGVQCSRPKLLNHLIIEKVSRAESIIQSNAPSELHFVTLHNISIERNGVNTLNHLLLLPVACCLLPIPFCPFPHLCECERTLLFLFCFFLLITFAVFIRSPHMPIVFIGMSCGFCLTSTGSGVYVQNLFDYCHLFHFPLDSWTDLTELNDGISCFFFFMCVRVCVHSSLFISFHRHFPVAFPILWGMRRIALFSPVDTIALSFFFFVSLR